MKPCCVKAFFLFLFSCHIVLDATSRYCGKELIGYNKIGNQNIKASTVDRFAQTYEARMHGGNGWIPDRNDKHPYLEIDLGSLFLVCGFEVRGCRRSWPTRYRVQVTPEKDYWDSWNYIKPEFYGGKNENDKVYSVARERKVGRYVRIFPYGLKLDRTGRLCMKVEIYGNPYLRVGDEVLVMENQITMSYKKTSIKKINLDTYKVEVHDRNEPLSYYPDYTQVIPSHVPLETEIRENSCVLTPGYHYVAGRVHETNGNKYRVEKLVDANRDYKGQTIRLHSFEREKLRVIFSAWCEKVEFFARVSKLRSKVSYGRIVSVDSKLVFLENAQGGLHRLSYKTQDAFFVSKREVRPDHVEPKKTKLWLPNMYGYLEPVTAPNKIILSLWIKRKPRIVWYKENDDKPDVCKNEAGLCYNSRIPFTVVRQNCTIPKIWDGKKCTDEDECKTGMAACALQATCKDTPGFYKCECKAGLKGKNPRTEDCKDVNECENKKNCHKDAICENTFGSFSCHCKRGFKGDGRHKCVQIDRCTVLSNKNHCEKEKNAICKNFPGKYQCVCKNGFHGNFKQCKDLDECTSRKYQCSPHAHCINTIGSYTCRCKSGYQGDGLKCEDKLECKEPSKSQSCHAHGRCVDTVGGYKCECKEGYYGDGVKSCVLANECELGIHKCHKTLATCVNTPQSYECQCNKGFEGDGRTCKDVDECPKKQHTCDLKAKGVECLNTDGSYKCVCAKGFSGDGKQCVDIDECKLGSHNCVKNAICVNLDGRFSCKCRYGFWGDATNKCEAQIPCLRALPHCDVPIKAECRHLPDNTFECVCKPGFTGDGFLIECVDVDECLNKEDYCSKHAVCSNLLGSFSCQCKDGFKGNGFECEDINECDSNKNKCPPNSDCVNTNGSFTCKCQSGFTGENPHKECVDLDECTLDRICDYGQRCTNTHGSYKCSCDQGYYLIDVAKNKCEDIDECSNMTMPCGRHNFIRCENTDGDYLCRCDQGFQFDKKEKQCKDTDECKTGEWPCAEDATCNNLQGSFRCTCPKGYHGDGEYICIANRSSLNGVTWITVVALVVVGLLNSPLHIIF